MRKLDVSFHEGKKAKDRLRKFEHAVKQMNKNECDLSTYSSGEDVFILHTDRVDEHFLYE